VADDSLDDLFSSLDDDAFETWPIKSTAHPEGKRYRVPAPAALDGLRLSAIGEITTKLHAKLEVTEADMRRLRLDDKGERDLMGQTLGEDLVQQLIADGVSWPSLQRLAQYMFLHWALGADAARKAAERGALSGKAQAPTNREGRRQQSQQQSRNRNRRRTH
jgi:hypothetical protein